jgi:UTP--glucose-1-phosphate uridylyltransferase
MWGDDLVLSKVSAVKQLIDEYEKQPCDGLLAAQEVPWTEVNRYGVLKIKQGTQDEVETVIEKPKREDAPSNLVSYGRYILTPQIFEYLKPEATGLDNEIWLQDANDQVAKHGLVRYKVIDGEWMTTGDPIRYMKAHLQFMLNHKDYGDELKKYIKEL